MGMEAAGLEPWTTQSIMLTLSPMWRAETGIGSCKEQIQMTKPILIDGIEVTRLEPWTSQIPSL